MTHTPVTTDLTAPEVSLWRLYALRAAYLLMAVGLGTEIWPGIIHHVHPWGLMQGVVNCMLGAVAVMAVLGLRYPVQMLPLLLFELVWKSLWLIVVALPQWPGHDMDAGTQETVVACLMGVIFPIVIPWGYVWASYVARPGDRWGRV
jgi:hypothetical protein